MWDFPLFLIIPFMWIIIIQSSVQIYGNPCTWCHNHFSQARCFEKLKVKRVGYYFWVEVYSLLPIAKVMRRVDKISSKLNLQIPGSFFFKKLDRSYNCGCASSTAVSKCMSIALNLNFNREFWYFRTEDFESSGSGRRRL